MANLIFYDETHKYTVDGVEVPSVSEITRFISREVYKDVQQFALDTAAARGTGVHKATEALDKYGSIEVTDELLPYIKAYVKFIKDYKPEWEKIEWSVNNGTMYAGTLDRYGTLRGVKAVVDVKTTGSITPAHRMLYTAAQNLYRMAIEPEHKVEGLFILQLRKDETYKLIELEIQNELADACLELHVALKKKKRNQKKEEE